MTKNRQVGLTNLWNSLRIQFQDTFFTPNERQPQKPNPLSTASLRKLGFYRNTDTGTLISPSSAQFSDHYYDNFRLERVKHPGPFPFYLKLTEDEFGRISSSHTEYLPPSKLKITPTKHRMLIEYIYSETDSLIIYNRLTNLDKHILLFIATFRNVQFQQIVRETGVAASRIEKALHRLLQFYLIRQDKFHRDPRTVGEEKASVSGDCYSIYSYGTTVLLVNNVITPEVAFKWREVTREADSVSPIRYWKIVDAYLNFRVKDDFIGFLPYSYMDSFLLTGEGVSPTTRDATSPAGGLSDQSQRIVQEMKASSSDSKGTATMNRRTKKVPRLRFNGQFLLKGKSGNRVRIDLYPFVTKHEAPSDLSKLSTVFLHYNQLQDGKDKYGEQRLLLIIVDSVEQIQLIEETYHLSDQYRRLNHILFLDVETASKVDVSKALKVLILDSQNRHVLKTATFHIDDALLARKDKLDLQREESEAGGALD